MLIVTACNDRYLPGVVALYNSFKAHVNQERNTFVCLTFGNRDLKSEIESHGIETVHNVPLFNELHLPAPGVWDNDKYDEDAMRACYCRIFLPVIFGWEKRALWVDGDCNFIRDVDELNDVKMHGHAIATPQSARQLKIFKAFKVKQTWPNLKTGTMLFDVHEYNRRQHFVAMYTFIEEHGKRFDDSTVNCAVNWEFKGKAARLSDDYSFNAKTRPPNKGVKILHWSICEPWNADVMSEKPAMIQNNVKKYWWPYAKGH